MFKIVNLSTNYNCDLCISDNGKNLIYLFMNDWNGEKYINSYEEDRNNNCFQKLNKEFKPIIKQVDEDNSVIIGFEEIDKKFILVKRLESLLNSIRFFY